MLRLSCDIGSEVAKGQGAEVEKSFFCVCVLNSELVLMFMHICMYVCTYVCYVHTYIHTYIHQALFSWEAKTVKKKKCHLLLFLLAWVKFQDYS